jgi:hypothetical protein
MEKNRAVVATLNAEVRRAKAAMRKEIPKLIRLATKKVLPPPPRHFASAKPQISRKILIECRQHPEKC